nr:BMS1-like protein [Cryptomonas sp.]
MSELEVSRKTNHQSGTPVIVSVVGPRRVGKTTFIKSIISHYSITDNVYLNGPVLVYGKEKIPYLFVESLPDKLSNINLAKASDIIILVIDCFFGLEMETFEFLSLALVHGCPRILCILTHLDLFGNWKNLKKAKKRIKNRLKKELNLQAKILYFSGICISEKYFPREISNVTRYLSAVFLYPSFLHKTTSYIVVHSLRIKKINNKNTIFFSGFNKGKTYDKSYMSSAYIPGIGKVIIKKTLDPGMRLDLFKNKNKKKMLNIQSDFPLVKKYTKFSKNSNAFEDCQNENFFEIFHFSFYERYLTKKNRNKIFPSKNTIDSKKFNSHKYFDKDKFQSEFSKNQNQIFNTEVNFNKMYLKKLNNNKVFDFKNLSIKRILKNNQIKVIGEKVVTIELNDFPDNFKSYFDPSYLIIISLSSICQDRNEILKAKIIRHKWNKIAPRSKIPHLISLGWKIFKTILIFFKEDYPGRVRFQKYLSSYISNFACFYSPMIENGSTIVGISEESSEIKNKYQGTIFSVVFTGNILASNKKLTVYKKHKLKGIVFKIFKKTAFIRNMFQNELEVSRFVGASVQSLSGYRGIIKKPIANSYIGSFRACFEKHLHIDDIVVLRLFIPVGIEKIYNHHSFFQIPSDLRDIERKNFLKNNEIITKKKIPKNCQVLFDTEKPNLNY